MINHETSEDESYRASYDISTDRLQTLTNALVAEKTKDIPNKYRYVTIEVEATSEYANIARHIERVVFDEAFGNNAEVMKQEYAPYESNSLFFISVDRGDDHETGELISKATGALRVIENSKNGLKTFNDLEGLPFSVNRDNAVDRHGIHTIDKVWDIGTIAVLPESRKAEGPVSVQLYRAMYKAALHNDIEHFISVIDARPLKKLTEYLGIPFTPLADSAPHPYLGSESSAAVYGHIPEFYEKMNRHRFTLKGILARKALSRLVKGSEDDSIVFSRSI